MLSENMELKIGDFGLAAKLESLGERKKTICGTPNYIAPEILEGKGHSYEVDIWSMGAILFALLYGRPPFETSDVKKTYKRIKECQYNFNDEIPVSDKAKNLISRLLVVDPTKRLTLEQIRSHPFLSDSKIPDTLPASIFSTALVKSSTETQLKSCGLERPESRAQSGISERLLRNFVLIQCEHHQDCLETTSQRQVVRKCVTTEFQPTTSSAPSISLKATERRGR